MENNNVTETCSDETVTISRAEYDQMLQKVASLEERVSELEKANEWYAEQIYRARNKLFGTSSAKASDEVLDQLTLFDEAETNAYLESLKETAPEKAVEVAAYTRKSKGSLAVALEKLPGDVEIEVEEHPDAEDKAARICPNCGAEMTVIGKEVVRTLKIIPARIIVHEDRYYTYACKACEAKHDAAVIRKTPHKTSFYPGSNAAPEAVAYIMYQKFVMGVPLYRMEKDFERRQIPLSRQTISNWVLHCSDRWLKPIYEELHRQLKRQDILHADETVLQVLKEPAKKAEFKSYMWLYRTGKYAETPIALYEYQPGRDGKYPEAFLSGFKGYLQTDGYAGYNGLDVIHVGCLAHLKRKFHDAVAVLPKDQKKGTAVEGEAYCAKLFNMEKALADLPPAERYAKRLELEKPVLDAFLSWGNTRNASEKSTLGKALTYLHNQGGKIANYLLDGRLEISNNLAEQSIKPFVIDRKNFLFANTPLGATGSAVMFSLIETAKETGLDPFRYLAYVFEQAPLMEAAGQEWAIRLAPAAVKDVYLQG